MKKKNRARVVEELRRLNKMLVDSGLPGSIESCIRVNLDVSLPEGIELVSGLYEYKFKDLLFAKALHGAIPLFSVWRDGDCGYVTHDGEIVLFDNSDSTGSVANSGEVGESKPDSDLVHARIRRPLKFSNRTNCHPRDGVANAYNTYTIVLTYAHKDDYLESVEQLSEV